MPLELITDLFNAGFTIVAYDLEKGRCTPEWALDHVRTTMRVRNDEGRAKAQALLDKWEARGV